MIPETVVPADQLMDTALVLARTILSNAPLWIRAFKELVVRSRALPEKEAVGVTGEVYDRLLLSDDAKEGPRAFAEKRSPDWQAR